MVAVIAIVERVDAVLPAAADGGAGDSGVCVNELVPGISFPMSGFASAGNDDTSASGRLVRASWSSGGEMHQSSDGAEDTLSVVDQADELAQSGLSAKVDDIEEPWMVMTCLADLDELNFAAEMIYDVLIPGRVPPLDRDVIFAAGVDDPERDGLSSEFVHLRVPGFLLG
jgi:hypothetical protein